MLNFATKGKMAEIECSQLEADRLGDEDPEPVARETLLQERKELIVTVSIISVVVLMFPWLLFA